MYYAVGWDVFPGICPAVLLLVRQNKQVCRNNDVWKQHRIPVMEQYNQELADAEREYEAGDYITREEMIKLVRQWQSAHAGS